MCENALKIRDSIEKHCAGNPYTTECPLKNIASSALIPDNVIDDILHFGKKGQRHFEHLIQDRLLPMSKISVWNPMRKLKIKAFANWMEKSKVPVGDKVIKLPEEHELLGRFLIIQGILSLWMAHSMSLQIWLTYMLQIKQRLYQSVWPSP